MDDAASLTETTSAPPGPGPGASLKKKRLLRWGLMVAVVVTTAATVGVVVVLVRLSKGGGGVSPSGEGVGAAVDGGSDGDSVPQQHDGAIGRKSPPWGCLISRGWGNFWGEPQLSDGGAAVDHAEVEEEVELAHLTVGGAGLQPADNVV